MVKSKTLEDLAVWDFISFSLNCPYMDFCGRLAVVIKFLLYNVKMYPGLVTGFYWSWLVRGKVPGLSHGLKNKIAPENPSYCPQYSNNHGRIGQFFILILQSEGKHYAETKSKNILAYACSMQEWPTTGTIVFDRSSSIFHYYL